MPATIEAPATPFRILVVEDETYRAGQLFVWLGEGSDDHFSVTRVCDFKSVGMILDSESHFELCVFDALLPTTGSSEPEYFLDRLVDIANSKWPRASIITLTTRHENVNLDRCESFKVLVKQDVEGDPCLFLTSIRECMEKNRHIDLGQFKQAIEFLKSQESFFMKRELLRLNAVVVEVGKEYVQVEAARGHDDDSTERLIMPNTLFQENNTSGVLPGDFLEYIIFQQGDKTVSYLRMISPEEKYANLSIPHENLSPEVAKEIERQKRMSNCDWEGNE